MIKANFKIAKTAKHDLQNATNSNDHDQRKDATKSEFEDYVIKSGASGSFMIFRSDKKEDELGLEEL